jgi:hypothetical protein
MVVGGAMIVLAVGVVIRTETRPDEAVAAAEAPPTQAAIPHDATVRSDAARVAPRERGDSDGGESDWSRATD